MPLRVILKFLGNPITRTTYEFRQGFRATTDQMESLGTISTAVDMHQLVAAAVKCGYDHLSDEEYSSDEDPTPPSTPLQHTLPQPSPTPLVPNPTPRNPPLSRRQKKNAKSKKSSHVKRDSRLHAAKAAMKYQGPVRKGVKKNHIQGAVPTPTNFDVNGFQATSTGYTGMGGPKHDEIFPLTEMVGESSTYKFRLQKWEGRASPVTDKNGYIFGVLVAHPKCDDWMDVNEKGSTLLEEARMQCKFTSEDGIHRRGLYPAMGCGISLGNGQKKPKRLSLRNDANRHIFRKLFSSDTFKRIAGAQSGAFATWAPKLHRHYSDTLEAVLEQHPKLTKNFTNSVFACATANFGPQTATFRHFDCQNLPYGWCGITALGDYDYVEGGHLILWECELVIEFPPGCTILIPSACISHSNVGIREGERRYSFTQYTAGALFRWIDHKFMNEAQFWGSLSEEERMVEKKKSEERLQYGLSLLSTCEELQK